MHDIFIDKNVFSAFLCIEHITYIFENPLRYKKILGLVSVTFWGRRHQLYEKLAFCIIYTAWCNPLHKWPSKWQISIQSGNALWVKSKKICEIHS